MSKDTLKKEEKTEITISGHFKCKICGTLFNKDFGHSCTY